MTWFEGPNVPFWLALPLLGIAIWAAFSGRIELVLGAYYVVVWQPPPTLDLWPDGAPIAATYFLLPLVVIAGLVYLHRRGTPVLARTDRRLLLWVVLWATWMIAVGLAFPIEAQDRATLMAQVIFRLTVPLWALWLFADDLDRIRHFSLVFVTIAAALTPHALFFLFEVTSLGGLIASLGSAWKGVSEVAVNYHSIALVGSVTCTLAIALLVDPAEKRGTVRTMWLLLGLLCGGALVVLSTSRQNIVGVLLVAVLLAFWVLAGRTHRKFVLPFVAAIGLVGASLASGFLSPYFRPVELSVDAGGVAYLAYRPAIFAEMWRWFLQSPILGNGLFYQRYLSHNIFLDALAAQGIIGFVFLIGLFGFAASRLRLAMTWTSHDSRGLWRVVAVALLLSAVLTASVSYGVLTADHVYFACILLWRLTSEPKLHSAAYSRVAIMRVGSNAE